MILIHSSCRKMLAAAAACGLSALAVGQEGRNRASEFRPSDYQKITAPSQAAQMLKGEKRSLADSITAAEKAVGGHAVRAECRMKSDPTAGGSGAADTGGARKMEAVCMVTLLVGDSRFVEVVVDGKGEVIHRDDQSGASGAAGAGGSGTGREPGMRGDSDRPRGGQRTGNQNENGALAGRSENGNQNYNSDARSENANRNSSRGARSENGNHNYNSSGKFRSVMFVDNENHNHNGADMPRDNDAHRDDGTRRDDGMRRGDEGRAMAGNQFAMATRTQKSSDLIGKAVTNNSNENLGRIEDIVVDANSGRILYAVLSFGGFMGMGDKWFAVPWQSLQLPADAVKFVFNVDKDRLKNAEGFDKSKWPDFANEQWATSNYKAYDQKPYWPAGDTQGGKIDWTTSSGYRQGWMNRPTVWKKASELDNREARNQSNEDLGTIDELIIDPDGGRVLYGLLDEGDEHIAVPWTALHLEQGGPDFKLNMTKAEVENVSGFTASNWPNFTDRTWATTNYRTYKTQPYWDVDGDGR